MTTPSMPLSPMLPTNRLRKARIVTLVAFFQLGVQLYLWSTSTVALRTHLGWKGAAGDFYWGMMILTLGVTAAVGAFAIGPIIDRYGSRRTVGITLIVHPLAIIPLAYANGLLGAIVATAVIGLTRGAHDTGVNAHGVEVQRHYGRSIMALFHAGYSAGGFAVGWIGSYLAERFTDSAAVGFTSFGIFLSIVGVVCANWLLKPSECLPVETSGYDGSSRPVSRRTTATLIIVVGFGFVLLASMLSEFSIQNWGEIFTDRVIGASAGVGAIVVTVFSGGELAGRLVVDRIVRRVGDMPVVIGSAILAVAGLVLLGVGGSTGTAILGVALAGLGIACVAPLMFSNTGRIDPANAGRNIGLVELMGYSGPIFGPVLVTAVVTGVGVNLMPLVPVVFMVVLIILTPFVLRHAAGYRKASETPHGVVEDAPTVTNPVE